MKKVFVGMMMAGVLMLIGSVGVDELGGDVQHALIICVRGLGMLAAGGIGLLYKTWLDDTREQRRQETIEERRKIR